MISSDDLRFIATIAQHRTLAEAARTLNITPPSVTQRIQYIEHKLSIQLLQRPSRRVSLTEEGRLLVDGGAAILWELGALQDKLDQRRERVSGKLRVLAPLGFGNDYIAPLLGQYSQTHSQLDVELELSDTPQWTSHQKWDVIIYIGQLHDSSLRMITLAPNQRFICAAPSYLEQHPMPQTPEDLHHHQCIALRENNEDVTVWSFMDHVGKRHTLRINPHLATNEGRVIKAWAMAGLGIIMRSQWDVQPQLDSGELVRLLPDYQLPDANIVALVSGSEQERSARISGFLTLLKQALSSSPWQQGHSGLDEVIG
ncbi:LysR family transcriptional regulator [Celerinatantimonas sp. YJH-8]|uniref:LysR family transcriptional regulator n=1 Tax=Celerinatantimonas sp. YJH-8 TaxID=3228714 RepID=UPI0038C98CE9